MASVSRRLRQREILHDRLYGIALALASTYLSCISLSLVCSCLIAKLMCAVGISGVVLMVTENEIHFRHSCGVDTYLSWLIRLINSMTTAILVILVFCYHYHDLTLYAVDNSLKHWRIGFTINRMFLITIEVVVCAIHPFPAHFSFQPQSKCTDMTIPVNVVFGLPSEYSNGCSPSAAVNATLDSVRSHLLDLPGHRIPIASCSRCLLAIARSSQSSLLRFSFPAKDVPHPVAHPMLADLLLRAVRGRQLVAARLRVHLAISQTFGRQFHVDVHCYLHHGWLRRPGAVDSLRPK